MQRDPSDLDSMLHGGGDEGDWLALVSQRSAASVWSEARERRRTVDDVAEAVHDRAWLAQRILALGRALRRTRPGSPFAIGLTLQPQLAAVLRESPPQSDPPVLWGQRSIRRARLGEVLHIGGDPGLRVWYSTAAGDGILAGPGWKVEAGDLPLLLVVTDVEASDLVTTLGAATRVAACLMVAEGENGV